MFLVSSLKNSLNLPALNTYLYSADGAKLQVYKPWNNAMREQTDYVENMIYENNALKRILVDGGYVEDGNYYFYETDYFARFIDSALGRFTSVDSLTKKYYSLSSYAYCNNNPQGNT